MYNCNNESISCILKGATPRWDKISIQKFQKLVGVSICFLNITCAGVKPRNNENFGSHFNWAEFSPGPHSASL